MTDVAIHVYESDNSTLVGEITAGQWRSASGSAIPLAGLGRLELPRIVANNTLNPALALIADGRLIRFTGDFGAWTMEIEDVDDQVLSESAEAGEVLTVTGRDWLTARAAKTNLRPDAGMGNLPHHPTRWLNFSADRLRDDDPDGPQGVWPLGTLQAPNYDTDTYFGRPEGYVDTSGEWVADRDSRTLYAPGGVWYFRQRVTLAETVRAVLVQFACDDEGELWVDNVPVVKIDGVYLGGSAQAVIPMAEGEHLIAGWVRNLNELRTGAIAAGWSTSDGMADELLWRLDGTARVLGFPDDPPGFTPTEVIRLVVDEEQDEGGLPGVGFSFISATDTASTPVSEVTDIATRAPASTLLTLLQMLSESYLDIDCDPDSLMIDAWVRGTRGEDRTADVVLEKGTATSVKHTVQGSQRATAVMVEGANFAPFEVRHDDYDTLGRSTVALDFGESSRATAERWATEYLDVVAEGRRGIEVKLHPAGPYLPGQDFNIGDRVAVLGGWNTNEPTNLAEWDVDQITWDSETVTWDANTAGYRVTAWGFEIDASSIVRYNVELDQPAQVLEERLGAIMRRFLPGGAGGRTILPSPVEPSFPAQSEGREKRQTWSADETGTVVLLKNATPIATLTATGRVTLTDNEDRKFVKGVDEFDITVAGESIFPAPWKPEDGRWVQAMSLVKTDTGVTVEVFIV